MGLAILQATRALYALAPCHGGGRAGTRRDCWAPGERLETAEDLSFMTSPALQRRFVAPLHAVLGRPFPHTIVHAHSVELPTLPTLLELDTIAAIEVPAIPLLPEIFDRTPLLLHGVISLTSDREITQALPVRGLGGFLRCGTAAEAATLVRALR